MKNPSNLKKICSFYVSKYHLVTMILPFLKEKLEQKAKIVTLLEENLTENMQTKIKQVVKKTSDLDIKEVNIKIKNIESINNIIKE